MKKIGKVLAEVAGKLFPANSFSRTSYSTVRYDNDCLDPFFNQSAERMKNDGKKKGHRSDVYRAIFNFRFAWLLKHC